MTKTVVLRIVHALRLGGLWLGPEEKQLHIFAKFAIFSFLSVYVLQIIALLMAMDDPERMFECFSVISFCGMGILKLFSMQRNRKIWQRLLNRMALLEAIENVPNSTDQFDNGDITSEFVKRYTNKFKRISTKLFMIYRFTAVLFIVSPFIEYGFFYYVGKKPEDYPHILPNWNPLILKHKGFYMVMIFFETVAACYCVVMHIAFHSAAIGVMIFICEQFNLLNLQCSKIAGDGRKLIPTVERNNIAHSRVMEYHRRHMLLVMSTNDLDCLLGNILGVYIFLATLTLCTISIRITSDQLTVMQMVSLLQYMCSTLLQLFIYCSFGDAVQNESSVGPGPLTAAHWCISAKVRREIVILGFGMMLPRRLHAGPFHRLDLATFIQIVRTAYSCYALLGKMNTN